MTLQSTSCTETAKDENACSGRGKSSRGKGKPRGAGSRGGIGRKGVCTVTLPTNKLRAPGSEEETESLPSSPPPDSSRENENDMDKKRSSVTLIRKTLKSSDEAKFCKEKKVQIVKNSDKGNMSYITTECSTYTTVDKHKVGEQGTFAREPAGPGPRHGTGHKKAKKSSNSVPAANDMPNNLFQSDLFTIGSAAQNESERSCHNNERDFRPETEVLTNIQAQGPQETVTRFQSHSSPSWNAENRPLANTQTIAVNVGHEDLISSEERLGMIEEENVSNAGSFSPPSAVEDSNPHCVLANTTDASYTQGAYIIAHASNHETVLQKELLAFSPFKRIKTQPIALSAYLRDGVNNNVKTATVSSLANSSAAQAHSSTCSSEQVSLDLTVMDLQGMRGADVLTRTDGIQVQTSMTDGNNTHFQPTTLVDFETLNDGLNRDQLFSVVNCEQDNDLYFWHSSFPTFITNDSEPAGLQSEANTEQFT